MKSLRRFLGVLWTLVAAVPFAARPEGHPDAGTATVSAPSRAPRSDTRASLGAVRIGLGESVLRDLKTPFAGTPSFRLNLTTRTTRSDGQTVRPSDGQTASQSHRARAPPELH
jgi:hypothetical protein